MQTLKEIGKWYVSKESSVKLNGNNSGQCYMLLRKKTFVTELPSGRKKNVIDFEDYKINNKTLYFSREVDALSVAKKLNN